MVRVTDFLFGAGSSNPKKFLLGSPDKLKKIPTGTPEQEALHNSILQQALGMTQQGGGYNQVQQYYNSLLEPGNDAYNNFAAPYLNQFNEQTLPGIAERFAGAGALSSSGFGQALGGAGAGLQAQLAQLFAELQSQAAGAQTNQYNNLVNTGLNHQQFAYQQKPGSAGFLGPFLTAIGSAAAGPIGGAIGQGVTGGISSLFKQSGGGLSAAPQAMGGGGGYGLPNFLQMR
jgi:hypothetical protein